MHPKLWAWSLISATCGAALLSPVQADAQPTITEPLAEDDSGLADAVDLETIVVTATRLPTPIDQVGRAVSVVTAKDIETRQQRFVYDALETVPGVQLTRSGSFGALSSISLRGLPSSQTVVLLDGLVLNDPSSFGNDFNFANFDSADVERIEVLRGAQSTLYGSNAVGGVVNIVTKDGQEGLGGSALVEGGSFDTVRGAASVYGGDTTLSGRLTAAGTTSNGFSSADVDNGFADDDGYRNGTLSGSARFQPTESLSFRTVARYSRSRNEFDDGAANDGDRRGETDELNVGGFANHTAFDGRWDNQLSLAYLRSERMNFNSGVTDFDAVGTRISLEYQGIVKALDWASVVYGAEAERQESEVAVGFGGNQEIDTYSGFGLVQLTPLEEITVNLGVRHDANSDFDNATTFSASAVVEIPGTGILLRGSYAEGFRAPSVGELSFNPDLEPEESEGWDIGLSRSFFQDRVTVEAGYFDQSISNQIAFDLAAFTFLNIASFETEGVELAVAVRPISTVELDFSYTYTDAFNVSGSIAALNQPDHRFSAQAVWQATPRLSLSGGVLFNGQESESGGRVLDSFTVLTLRGAYRMTDHLELFARVENATDTDYQDNIGFATAPASAFGGIRVRL